MPFETHTLMPGFRLHVKQTKQFKTTAIRVFLARNLDANTTRAALLPYILRRGTRSYPTMNRISRRLEGLYGTAAGTDVGKVGDRQLLTFFADVPNERYLPTHTPVLARTLEFLNELIFEPAGEDGFVQEHFESEKRNLEKFIQSLSESRSSYAIECMVRNMCEGEPYAHYEYGDVEELNRIKSPGLYRFYSSLRTRVPVDIYVVGDLDPSNLLRRVVQAFRRERSNTYKLKNIVVKSARRRPRNFTERAEVAQGRLVMGYRANVGFTDKHSRALAMAAAVLGGFPYSKLFRAVREKASLAYSVSAHMIRSKGIMLVYAGVEPGNEGKARRLIEGQFSRLRAGEISDFELDTTKTIILSELAAITDSPSREIDLHYVHLLHGEHTTAEEAARRLKELTKKEIAAAAARLKLDTVFVLTSARQKLGEPAGK